MCPHKYHHNGFVVHIGGTDEPKSLHQAQSKEDNINCSDVS